MPDIELKGISNYVFRDLNMTIFDRELLGLFGPNGAGKTTLLNIIAGLVNYKGSVLFDGFPIDKVPTSKRKIGYLFQNLALFPHLDVSSNIAYSLRVLGEEEKMITEKVDELLKLMKIEHLSERYPRNLSGDEKQRVALARALAPSPRVLLLDEPFSSLDDGMCGCLRREIGWIQRELGVTTVFVTHDLRDVKEICDRFVWIKNGKMVDEQSEESFYKGVQDCTDCRIDCFCKA